MLPDNHSNSYVHTYCHHDTDEYAYADWNNTLYPNCDAYAN